MQTRALGKTGLRTTELALGTWGLAAGAYGAVPTERFVQTVSRALEVGVRTFDLAPTWGDDGASERVVARIVGDKRDEALYVTRAGQAVAKSGRLRSRFDATHLAKDCERSLARLATDRIDVLLLNHPSDGDVRAAETREVCERLVREGKVRAWGVSTSRAATARVALESGAQVLCLPYHLLSSEDVDEVGELLASTGAGLLARSPLAHGLLAGGWALEHTFASDDHRERRWTPALLRDRLRAVAHLRFLVHDDVATLAQAALRWTLANELVSATIVGARSPAQIAEAALVSSGTPYLPDEDLVRVTQVVAAARR